MNRAAGRVAYVVLFTGLSGPLLMAEQFSTVLTDEQIQERVRLDGRTLVHDTRGVRGFTQTQTVDVQRLDLADTKVLYGIIAADGTMVSIERATAPASVSALALKCKDAKPCISVSAQFDGTSDVRAQTLGSSVIEMSVRCPGDECGRLLVLVRAACGCVSGASPQSDAGIRPDFPDQIDFPGPKPSSSPSPSPRPSPPRSSEQQPENLVGTEWRGHMTGEFNGRRGLWTQTDAFLSVAFRDRGYAVSEYALKAESARWTQLPGSRVEITTTIPILNCTGALTIRARVENGAMQGRFEVAAGACGAAKGDWEAQRTR